YNPTNLFQIKTSTTSNIHTSVIKNIYTQSKFFFIEINLNIKPYFSRYSQNKKHKSQPIDLKQIKITQNR
ncbi:hypothetical protein, partial [Xenorhabdus thuongxuanensis]|uniref:hypothetical protein n=1 Tax=Xenorhabdus thuongxuanensis TaxID=1873484 RepID=UPI0039EF2C0D